MIDHEKSSPSCPHDQVLLHGLLAVAPSSSSTPAHMHQSSHMFTRRGLFAAGAALLAGSAAALISGSRVAAAAVPQVETASQRSVPQVQREAPAVQMAQPKADRSMVENTTGGHQPVAVAHNHDSIAQVAAPETAAVPEAIAAQPAPGTTYMVRSGDTLSSISLWAYGSASYWHAIYEANYGVIGGNPNLIHPGQVLSIPYLNIAPPTPGQKPIGSSYTVQPGDTLGSIAWRMYGNSGAWSVIYNANRGVIGANPHLILPGQVLAIPAY